MAPRSNSSRDFPQVDLIPRPSPHGIKGLNVNCPPQLGLPDQGGLGEIYTYLYLSGAILSPDWVSLGVP
jgi:hypothetical protein